MRLLGPPLTVRALRTKHTIHTAAAENIKLQCVCVWVKDSGEGILRRCMEILFHKVAVYPCFVSNLTDIDLGCALVLKCHYTQCVSHRNCIKPEAYPFGMEWMLVVLQ